MKQIINGKMYNTDTATLIGQDNNTYHAGDFNFENTKLYQSPKNAFFLAGRGGALSRWAVRQGGGRSGGSGIQLLTTTEAMQWCSENDIDSDTVERYFQITEG